MFGVSIYTIRFYDKEGLLPFVLRNKAGNRVFTESDVSLFGTICCLKIEKYTSPDAMQIINEERKKFMRKNVKIIYYN